MTESALIFILSSSKYSGKDQCWALKQLQRKGWTTEQVMAKIGR